MNKAKVFEAIGFIMIIAAFIIYLCNDQEYLTSLSEYKTTVGLLGLLIWSLAYAQRESKTKKD